MVNKLISSTSTISSPNRSPTTPLLACQTTNSSLCLETQLDLINLYIRQSAVAKESNSMRREIHLVLGIGDAVAKLNEWASFKKPLYEKDYIGKQTSAIFVAFQAFTTESDRDSVYKWLEEIESTDRKDVYMNIVAALTDLINEPVKKLHTACSRNDQVSFTSCNNRPYAGVESYRGKLDVDNSNPKKLPGGRFEDQVTDAVESFNEKYSELASFVKALYKQVIMGRLATLLASQGSLSENARDSILKGLEEIERKIEAGVGVLLLRSDREDCEYEH